MGGIYRTKYSTLRGTDFSSDASLISKDRASILENLIPDEAGYPQKRAGWRTLYNYGATIYGAWVFKYNGEEQVVVHAGDKLYKHGTTPTQLISGINEHRSSALMYNDRLFILTGNEYISYNGTSAVKLLSNDTLKFTSTPTVYEEDEYTTNGIYIPLTSYGGTRSADLMHNGTAFEKVNLLTRWRRNSFITATGYTQSNYILYRLDTTTTVTVTLQDGIYRTNDIAIKMADGTISTNFRVYTEGNGFLQYSLCAARSEPGFWADGAKVKIDFLCVRGDIVPTIEGKDNVTVYFYANGDVDTTIQKCSVMTEYANRFFVTGNTQKQNFDWHSDFEKPTYFPDVGYTKFGDDTPVMGYLNTSSTLAIFKGKKPQSSGIYLRSESTLNGETIFPVKQMASGIDSVSSRGFCNLLNDDLFLTDRGIYAITSLDYTNEKAVANRSYYIDKKLCAEPNLENAIMTKWKNLCLCAVNSHCYILNADASQSYNTKGDLLYDCYYWTNIPAVCFLPVGDSLYFGTADGKFCMFNTDIEGVSKYNDDGVAIYAVWGTKSDDDGDITKYKTLLKKGNSVTVKPYTKSSVHIILRTEKDYGKEVAYDTADIFDWQNLSFERVSFNSMDTPLEIMINSRIKNYKRLQIVIYNNALNEGFGIFEINKNFAFGNFAK